MEMYKEIERAKVVGLTNQIRLRADNIGRDMAALRELVAQAKELNAAELLGYASWTAYLIDVLAGVSKVQLDRQTRIALVGELTSQGISTTAVGAIVGVSKATAVRDVMRLQAAAEARGETLADVTGLNGKTFRREVILNRAEQRHPMLMIARTSGRQMRTTANRFVRMVEDERFKIDRDAIVDTTTLIVDLTFTIEVCQKMLSQLEGAGGLTPTVEQTALEEGVYAEVIEDDDEEEVEVEAEEEVANEPSDE